MSLRLRKSILKRWAALTWRYNFRLVKRESLLWLLNHRNFVDREFAVYGGFESSQRHSLFSLHSGKADIFVDIGANFGLYTLDAVKRAVASEYIAFEPDPRNYAQLQANLLLNSMTRAVAVHPKALTSTTGSVRLALHVETSTGTTRISCGEEGAFEVGSLALDDLLGVRDKTILIKMDIEGHEIYALQGMKALLLNNKCFLQIEVFDSNREQVDSFMYEKGYKEVRRIESDSFYVPLDFS